MHRWAGGSFASVCDWLSHPKSQASAHVVYAGGAGEDAGRARQLVPFAEKAWTESHLNPIGYSIESADAIWLGHDPEGFAQLARIVALLCHIHRLPARAVSGAGIVEGESGFCRHADGGALAGGHTSCPTRDLALWQAFAARVSAEYRHGGFRDKWGR